MKPEELLARLGQLAQQQGGKAPDTAEELYALLKQSRQGSKLAVALEKGAATIAPGVAGGGPADHGKSLAGVMQKALAESTPSAGGVLVPPEVAEEIMGIIRARSIVMGMGPTVVPVAKELSVPRMSTGTAAQYVQENARLPVSEPTFVETPLLRPIEIGHLVPVSNRLLRDALTNPTLDQKLRADMGEAIALRQDLAFLQGMGGGTEPLGIRNHSGLTPAPALGANGASPTFDHLKDMVAGLRDANAPFNRPGWAFNPRTINTLEKLKTTTGEYLGDRPDLLSFDATGGGGKLLGFRFKTTTQIPKTLTVGTSNDCSYIIFSSDWDEAWVGENDTLAIDASGEATYSLDGTTWVSAYQSRQTVFRATAAHDFALRRPEFFSVMEGVRP